MKNGFQSANCVAGRIQSYSVRCRNRLKNVSINQYTPIRYQNLLLAAFERIDAEKLVLKSSVTLLLLRAESNRIQFGQIDHRNPDFDLTRHLCSLSSSARRR